VWDNFCKWCATDHCLPNTIHYDNQEVVGEGGNCFIHDSQCIHTSATNQTVNSLCELTVSTVRVIVITEL
jgi:hypothetical protein